MLSWPSLKSGMHQPCVTYERRSQAVALVFDHVRTANEQHGGGATARTVQKEENGAASADGPPASPLAGSSPRKSGTLSHAEHGPINSALKLLDDLCMMVTGKLSQVDSGQRKSRLLCDLLSQFTYKSGQRDVPIHIQKRTEGSETKRVWHAKDYHQCVPKFGFRCTDNCTTTISDIVSKPCYTCYTPWACSSGYIGLTRSVGWGACLDLLSKKEPACS